MNEISPSSTVLLTEKAAAKVTSLIAEEGDDRLMLRLSVSGGGCSGFSYGFSLDADSTNDDKVFEFHGVKLVIDDMSLDLLGGSQIDYVDDLMAASFRITNPNASSTCGCGTSFSL
ncbi:MAG: iron-sulfur cluster insertion protein ErpA [Rhodospirillaceae bacterium]|nr:iron-sulfur cluster insertion protein ErpA [Rhodospirillaceae bacterium]